MVTNHRNPQTYPGWWLSPTPLKNDGLRQLDDYPIYGKTKTLWNHQPDIHTFGMCKKNYGEIYPRTLELYFQVPQHVFYVSPFLWGQWGSQWSWRHVITHPTSRPSLWVDGIKDMLNEGQLSAQHMIRSTCRAFFLTQAYFFQQFWYSYHIHEAIYYLERVTMWHLEKNRKSQRRETPYIQQM